MLAQYLAVLLLIFAGLAFGLGIVIFSAICAKRVKTASKEMPYECGLDTKEDSRNTFAIKFNVTTLIFLVFDVEIAFLFPLAILLKEGIAAGNGAYLILEMAVFVLVLAFALVYAIYRQGLEWD